MVLTVTTYNLRTQVRKFRVAHEHSADVGSGGAGVLELATLSPQRWHWKRSLAHQSRRTIRSVISVLPAPSRRIASKCRVTEGSNSVGTSCTPRSDCNSTHTRGEPPQADSPAQHPSAKCKG